MQSKDRAVADPAKNSSHEEDGMTFFFPMLISSGETISLG
jgi:hypothetical protein